MMFVVAVVVLICRIVRVFSYVSITNGVYSGISVGLHRSLQESNCEKIVNSVQEMFNSASGRLSSATSGLSFGSIFVVVPDSWATCGNYPVHKAEGYMTYNTSTVRISELHPLFGFEPWTNQPNGCGKQGEFISMPADWMLSTEYDNEQRGSRLIHEWAKYRWGVFEEYGHYEDPVYPESIRQSGGSFEPNFCTNKKLNGQFSSSCASSPDCKFDIGSSNSVSSSIMAVPELPSVKSFCDDNTHRFDLPTKQNLVCNYTSSWTVISKHSDIAQYRQVNSSPKSVEIKVLRENFANSLIITYETSKAMEDIINRFEFEKESIAQFIVYEAPDSAKIGLVNFGKIATPQTNGLQVLDSPTRQVLAKKVIDTQAAQTSAVNLQLALHSSANMLKEGNGIILLVTRCTGQVPSFTAEELALAADCHPVWIVLYPTNTTANLNVYSNLSYLTGGKLLVIQEEVIYDDTLGMYANTSIRMQLSQAMRQLLHLEPAFDYRQISYETCPSGVFNCDKTMTSTNDYENPMFVNIYHDSGDEVQPSSTVTVKGGSCSLDDYGSKIKTTNVFKCSSVAKEPVFNIHIYRKRSLSSLNIELVGRPVVSDPDFQFDLLRSSNLYGFQYTANSAPVLSVQLSSNGTNIVYANVSATVWTNLRTKTYDQILLRDDGTGADITGNDGIYSAFLVPQIPVGKFSVSFDADSNDGKARFWPSNYNSKKSYVCCGSVIPLPSDLTLTQEFSVSSLPFSGAVTQSPPNLNLPPGPIRDLQFIIEGDSDVRVMFTATGEDLTYGTAAYYILRHYQNKQQDATEKILSFTPKPSGSTETYVENSLPCNTTNTVSLYAVDDAGLRGIESNRITVYVSCNVKKGGLSVGAAVGITFAVLFALILVIGCIVKSKFYKRGPRDDRGVYSKLKACTCCDGEDSEHHYNTSSDTTGATVKINAQPPPVHTIRTLNDLVVSQEKELELSEENVATNISEHDNAEYNQHKMKSGPQLIKDNTYLVMVPQMPRHGSERSLQSAQTASPFVSTNSMNRIGIPYSPPSSSNSDYKTIPLSKSNDSLYDTQV